MHKKNKKLFRLLGFGSDAFYLRRAWVGRPGGELVVGQLRTGGHRLRGPRPVVYVELAVGVGGHGQQLQQGEPVLRELGHAQLHQAMCVVDDASLRENRRNLGPSPSTREILRACVLNHHSKLEPMPSNCMTVHFHYVY